MGKRLTRFLSRTATSNPAWLEPNGRSSLTLNRGTLFAPSKARISHHDLDARPRLRVGIILIEKAFVVVSNRQHLRAAYNRA
jgi:hypothetical protein